MLPLSPPAISEEQLHWGRIRLVWHENRAWDVVLNVFQGGVNRFKTNQAELKRTAYGTPVIYSFFYSPSYRWQINEAICTLSAATAIGEMANLLIAQHRNGYTDSMILLEDTITPHTFNIGLADPVFSPERDRVSASEMAGYYTEGDLPSDRSAPSFADTPISGVQPYYKYGLYSVFLKEVTYTQLNYKLRSVEEGNQGIKEGYVLLSFTAEETEVITTT